MIFKSKKKLGLALGGGAARGLAHIGVLNCLEKHNISISTIAGTSMGALIGALYAETLSAKAVEERFRDYIGSDVFKETQINYLNDDDSGGDRGVFVKFSQIAKRGVFYAKSFTQSSFIDREVTAKNFRELVSERQIEELKIPFCATAVELNSGTEYIFQSGSLQTAIMASCALPGILPPIEIGELVLVDGGWLTAVPIEPARSLGADVVIAIDVKSEMTPMRKIGHSFDVMMRADAISRHALAELKLKTADLALKPIINDAHWTDFSRIDEIIAHGYREAESHLKAIKRLI